MSLAIEEFFDERTMSVHLKADTYPYAKRGGPGAWDLVRLEEVQLSADRIKSIAEEIIDAAREDEKSFVEIQRSASTIVQYRAYRIVIVTPPVSDGWEITAVKPLVKLDLNNYDIPEKIKTRLEERSSGIIISGQVGSGKSTFASALAEDYAKIGRITKTIESPRDLMLSEDITQYSKNLGSDEEIHDILFLTRPDNVIFDEMRDTPDFKLFIDIRLGGSSVIGVLHAAEPIDTIQRFIARMDVGMIPSVLDTIIFIDKGEIAKVLVVKMMVKVPSGMTESDLARPVIEVRDLEKDKLEFEIYSYGEQTIVIPISDFAKKSPAFELAEKQIKKEMQKYCSACEVEMIANHRVRVYVPRGEKKKLIGLKGANISAIEKRLGLSIDVTALENTSRSELHRLDYHVTERGRSLVFSIGTPGKMVDVHIEDEFLFTSTSSKKSEIKVNKRSELGSKLLQALDEGKAVYIKG
tara:strand:+ start:1143 stop:2543 length:1401 start_codon:yes stop_codon:yes gene_type:complete